MNRKKMVRVGVTLFALLVFFLAGLPRGARAAYARYTVYYQFNTPTRFFLFPTQVLAPFNVPAPVYVMSALIEGPPKDSFLRPTLPAGTRLLGVDVKGNVAFVNFSNEVTRANVGAEGEAVMIGSIVNTLCALPGIQKVQILVEGKPVESLAGHVDCRGPLSSSFELVWRGFPDVRGHWGEGAILGLCMRGVLAGYADGRFKPDSTVTRAEFLKMVVETMGERPEPTQKASFKDVPPSHWSHGFVERAVSLKLIRPTEYSGVLRPDQPMPRKEMAVILVRAAGEEQKAQRLAGSPLSFSDTGTLPAWLKGYIACAVEEGLLNGFPDRSFRPDGILTRAEAATVMMRLDGMGGRDIVVAWPKKGSSVSSPALVAGAARVFEANVSVRVNRIRRETVTDERGKETEKVKRERIAETYVMASEGAPAWGVFAVALPFEPPYAPPGPDPKVEAEVEAYWVSPRDGTEQGTVRIPVFVKPR